MYFSLVPTLYNLVWVATRYEVINEDGGENETEETNETEKITTNCF